MSATWPARQPAKTLPKTWLFLLLLFLALVRLLERVDAVAKTTAFPDRRNSR